MKEITYKVILTVRDDASVKEGREMIGHGLGKEYARIKEWHGPDWITEATIHFDSVREIHTKH